MACPRKSIVRKFCPTRYGFQRIAGRPDGRVPERAEGGASGRGRTAGRRSDRRAAPVLDSVSEIMPHARRT